MTFDDVMRELGRTYFRMIILANFLTTTIVFLVSFILLATLGVPWWYALFPAVICFIILHHLDSGKNPYGIIEDKYPDLADKLSAGKDTLDEEQNVFARDLHEELRKELRKVMVSSFINTERLRKDLLFIALLAILIVIISPFNPVLLSLNFNPADFGLGGDGGFFNRGGSSSGTDDGEGDGAGGGSNEDIFGDKSIAVLGDEDLNVQLHMGDDSFDFSKLKKTERFEFKAVYPDEIEATASSSFEENIPKDQQDIVKKYYKKLAEK